jgi:hypothetical protein
MMQGEDRKLLSFFNLRDALDQPGCPVCTLAERNSLRFLDALLYERVNDVGTREGLRKSLGFCNWHAWKSLEVPNCPLGLGIIYHDLLEQIQERLGRIQRSFPLRIPYLRRLWRKEKAKHSIPLLRPSHSCPACRSVRFFEEMYMETLLDFLAEEDFERQFSGSSGICFPHLTIAIEKYPGHRNLGLLIQMQAKKVESLREELAEFIRKHDYKFVHEPRGAESDSWRRALELVAGKREVFGNQVRRMSDGRDGPAAAFSPPEAAQDENRRQELFAAVKRLEFEKEKLGLKCQNLREDSGKEKDRASSLHCVARKGTEENKNLQKDLAEAKTQVQLYAAQVEHLNREIDQLKKLLKAPPGDKTLDPQRPEG